MGRKKKTSRKKKVGRNKQMGRKKKDTGADGLFTSSEYRHGDKRKNIPPAAIAGQGEIPRAKRIQYAYSPHLDPVLRFDPTGRADRVQGIVEKAIRREPLTGQEQEVLRAVGKNWEQPWLEWAGKQEEHTRAQFDVDPVALHIHERISAQAILRNAMRKDTERSLFADPEQSYAEAVQFYKYDVDWANRLILGDSLQVMSSLAQREDLAGKVRMIYIDPPYGIKFASNFQPELGKHDIQDGNDAHLTREAETVKAFRDTWHLGISSYLTYLRDRLLAARSLLCDSGSVFVQISDENLHRMRLVLSEVFGDQNFIGQIAFQKTGGFAQSTMASSVDYLLWFAKNRESIRFRHLHRVTLLPDGTDPNYALVELLDGSVRRMTPEERRAVASLPSGARVFRYGPLTSEGKATGDQTFEFAGRIFEPSGNSHWKTNAPGRSRLLQADRLIVSGNNLSHRMFWDYYAAERIGSYWNDTQSGGFNDPKVYVVQTTNKVVERCILMATDPGDLVIDPTCGSGTTAYVAEQWGRRWITIDTSRVALSTARQRILTARFEHFRTKGGPRGLLGAEDPSSGFTYNTVPHITLKSIAHNANLDPIFVKYREPLAAKLAVANTALASVSANLRDKLKSKLDTKRSIEGKKSITDADRRRWVLPPDQRDTEEEWTVDAAFGGWYDWEVPFDTDPDWPKALSNAVIAYRTEWRRKMNEVNACIAANAEQEELVDQPEVVKGVVRVSGPFTVEGMIPEELSLTEAGLQDLTPDQFEGRGAAGDQQNAHAYLDGMLRALSADGVLFPNNRKRMFASIEPLFSDGKLEGLHAEGAWEREEERNVAIAFGPQYGPVTAKQVEQLIRASRRYEHLVIAGFSFAPEASLIIAENKHPGLQIHMAHIRPDLSPAMKGLLKETPNSQLFTVFGLPSVKVRKKKGGEFEAELEGVDIYDPINNVVRSTKAEKVAAWFLDSDYDDRCFCTCQAFFPDQDAWEKIAKALGSAADLEAFGAFKGTVSLPFGRGEHGRIAIKVIDPRGNEVMTVSDLPD
jgi:adenine-specific DNA-methyltransferase